MKGMLFDIQRASCVDGPGIRTAVFFKGCNLRCAWCHNPESREREPQLLLYRDKCTGCGRCREVCPHSLNACSLCGSCALHCPGDARVLCGRLTDADEVMEVIEQDLPYFRASGGGVTFSGGECMLQPEFLAELLRRCRARGIQTAVDTAGCVPYREFQRILADTDLFLYDIKTVTPELHKQYTGADNERILDNYKRLLADGARVIVRVPMIPEVNANDLEFPMIAAFLRRYPPERTELLKYHVLGENKYRALSGEERTVFSVPTDAEMARFRAMLPDYGGTES